MELFICISALMAVFCFFGGGLFFLIWSNGYTSGWWSILFFVLTYINILVLVQGIHENDNKPKTQYYECKTIFTKRGDIYVKDSVFVKINIEDFDISK